MLIKKILGIDPGLRHTGWGIIEQKNNQISWNTHGVCHSDANTSIDKRLASLYSKMKKVIELHQPDEICIEEIFINVNPKTTLKLGMARGVLLMLPALYNIPLFEYRPNEIKKAVVGNGHAKKEQIIEMIKHLLKPSDILTADSADALAIAVSHAHYSFINNKL